jgi:hypothetical protein
MASSALESRGVTPKVRSMFCKRSKGAGMAKKYHTIAISEGMSVPRIRSDPSGTGMTKVIRGFLTYNA